MRTLALLNFCSQIEESSLSQLVQSTPWIVPTVQTLHILGIAALLSCVLMINLRLLGITAKDQSLVAVTASFRWVIRLVIPFLLITGIIMISGEPARSLANSVFQLKMLLLLTSIVVMWGSHHCLNSDPAYWERSTYRKWAAKAVAILSLGLWIGIVCAGRWIAYT